MPHLARIETGAVRLARWPRLSLSTLACLLVLCTLASAQEARWHQLITSTTQLYDQGKYEQALAAAQEALRLAGTLFPPESRQVSVSMNDLALVLVELDRFSEAESLHRRALAIDEKTLGPSHPEVASALNNLGELCRKMGRLAEAKDLLTRALAIREKALDPNDPNIATSAGNLAAVLSAQGEYTDAEPLDRRALAIDEKALGPADAGVAADLNNLGEVLYRQAKYAQAEPLYIRALSIHIKLFGNEHIFVAGDLDNLGSLYVDQGRYTLAEATYRRALAIDEKASTGKGSRIALDLSNLAGLLDKQARYAESEPLYRRALDIDEKAFGPEHPAVAGVLSNLATLYYTEGRYQDAENAYGRALAIREKVLGAAHPLVAATLNGLALLRQDQGRYAESESLYLRAIAIDEKALGPEHPQVARMLNALGELYLEAVRVPAAVPLFRRALAIHEKSFGLNNPDVAADLNNLALAYDAAGQPDQAAPMFRQIVAIHEKLTGPSGFQLVAPLLNLGSLLQRQRDFAGAEQSEKRALAILLASAGPDHSDTRGALLDLAITYYGSGRSELAATYFDQGLASLVKQVDSSLTYMSERQRLQFLATEPGAFPLLFSFVVANRERNPSLAGKMYDGLLWQKGLIASNSAALRARILDSGDPQAINLFDQLTAKRAKLAAMASAPPGDSAEWRKTMAQLDQEANSIETDLVKRSAALADAKALARLTWHDVQKALKPNEAAVEYVRFPVHDGVHWTHTDAYAAVVLTPASPPRVLLLGEARKLEAGPVAAYRAGVAPSRGVAVLNGKSAPAPAEGLGTAAAYAAFWQPLEEALAGARRIYVSGDGILNQVPIGLFSDSAGKLLLEKYDLRMVNSTKDLLRPQRSSSGKTAVVIGNPAFDLAEASQREAVSALATGAAVHAPAAWRGSQNSSPLPPLPATQAEAQAVAGSLKDSGWQVSIYTGSLALEEAIDRARSPRVVHVATHGFFLATPAATGKAPIGDPMLRSGLYFAGADRARAGEPPAAGLQDGILRLHPARPRCGTKWTRQASIPRLTK